MLVTKESNSQHHTASSSLAAVGQQEWEWKAQTSFAPRNFAASIAEFILRQTLADIHTNICVFVRKKFQVWEMQKAFLHYFNV